MDILVLAGSPKGEISVTRQYIQYLINQLSDHTWRVVDVASQITKLERDVSAFQKVVEHIRSADIVLWAFPVYVLLVPAGLKRFIELVHERGAADVFESKYAASLSTSIHFHDNCAHDYIRAVSEDLHMHFVGSHSPEMYDLQKESGRCRLLAFGHQLLQITSDRADLPTRFRPLPKHRWEYRPGPVDRPVDLHGRRVVIVHDATAKQTNLKGMIDRLHQSLHGDVEVFNLHDIKISGNCLGCLRCASANRCAYEGRDEFIPFYERVRKQADILIFAGSVVDRHLSSRWRQFFERAFYNTHQPSFAGRQMAFVIAGPASHMSNLHEVLKGYVQWQEANLIDVVSDEIQESTVLDRQLSTLARRLVHASEASYVQPFDFLGVGGQKVFRDHIFGPLRFMFPADHRYYVRTRFYDFPTRNWGMRLRNVVLGAVLKNRRIRRGFDRKVKQAMVQPLHKWSEAPETHKATEAITTEKTVDVIS